MEAGASRQHRDRKTFLQAHRGSERNQSPRVGDIFGLWTRRSAIFFAMASFRPSVEHELTL